METQTENLQEIIKQFCEFFQKNKFTKRGKLKRGIFSWEKHETSKIGEILEKAGVAEGKEFILENINKLPRHPQRKSIYFEGPGRVPVILDIFYWAKWYKKAIVKVQVRLGKTSTGDLRKSLATFSGTKNENEKFNSCTREIIKQIKIRKNGSMFMDLHVHTRSSADATHSSAELVERLKNTPIPLNGFAITDHNSTYEGINARSTDSISIIPGVEVYTKDGDRISMGTLHIKYRPWIILKKLHPL